VTQRQPQEGQHDIRVQQQVTHISQLLFKKFPSELDLSMRAAQAIDEKSRCASAVKCPGIDPEHALAVTLASFPTWKAVQSEKTDQALELTQSQNGGVPAH
jgi:hypothetical protein